MVSRHVGRKIERGLLVAVVMSVFLLLGIYVWSMKRRDWLYACWDEVSAIDTVPAARRYLDGYLRQIERAGMVRGNTALFTPVPESDLASWYQRVSAERRALARVEGQADPLAHALALRSFRARVCIAPFGTNFYPYQRTVILAGTLTGIVSIGCILIGRRKFREASEPPFSS